MPNAIMVISPYWYEGTWVFDDETTGLQREPFVAGVPEMVDELVRDIPDARRGFRLTFSDQSFPGAQAEGSWVREEMGGNWYKTDLTDTEGWLCPALFKYFDRAPQKIYVRADPKQRAESD